MATKRTTAKTPTTAIIRALKEIGLTHGSGTERPDFAIQGRYHTSGGIKERRSTYVVLYSREARELVAANADRIEELVDADGGWSVTVSVYYSDSGQAHPHLSTGRSDRVRQQPPATTDQAPAVAQLDTDTPTAQRIAHTARRLWANSAQLLVRYAVRPTDTHTDGSPRAVIRYGLNQDGGRTNHTYANAGPYAAATAEGIWDTLELDITHVFQAQGQPTGYYLIPLPLLPGSPAPDGEEVTACAPSPSSSV